MTTSDENGNKQFKETFVKSDKEGNLVDQYGARYSGTYSGQNVSFTQEGSTHSFAGEWKQNSNLTSGIKGVGSYEGFKFTFQQPGSAQTLGATWHFQGTRKEVQGALEAAGFRHWPIGFHEDQTEYRLPAPGRNSIHFDINKVGTDPKTTVPTTGDMHVGEYYPFPNPFQHFWHDVLHQ